MNARKAMSLFKCISALMKKRTAHSNGSKFSQVIEERNAFLVRKSRDRIFH